MDYQIRLPKKWGYRHHKRGRCELDPGVYSVPEEIAHDVAMRAIGEGVAEKLKSGTAPPPAKPLRKTRAPRNKARGAAPENKSTLV